MAQRRSVEDTWVLSALTRQNSTFTRQDLAREVNLLTKNADRFQALMARQVVEASGYRVRGAALSGIAAEGRRSQPLD